MTNTHKGIRNSTVMETWEDRPVLRHRYTLLKPGADAVEFSSLYRLPSLLVDAGVSPNIAKVAGTNMMRTLNRGFKVAWHLDIRVKRIETVEVERQRVDMDALE